MAYLFAFFCGGSGARVAEMYAFCAAMGLTRHDIPTHICLCDADHQNGNEATSLGTIKNYVTVRSEMYREGHTPAGAGDFFGTPISAGQWALDGRNDKNAGLAQYTLDQLGSAGDAGFVSKALFTEEERTRDIKNLGFFAHPNVGNAIVQAAILYEQDVADDQSITTEYKRTKQMIIQRLNAGDRVYVVFVGSLFGGTGAACMPTIAQDLRSSIQNYCQEKGMPQFEKIFHMSAVMLLPYFIIPQNENGEELVDNGIFDSSTKIAMDYYFRKHPNLFETIYPIGLPTSYLLPGKAEYGGEKQKNPSSLVEWVATLAVCDFVATHDVNDAMPVHSKLCCASLNVDDENKYVLRNSSFMSTLFGETFNRWNEFAAFYALYLYPNIKLGNEGGKVPNWYRNYIIMEADNPAIDQMFVFIQTYYNSIKELLGMSLYDGAQPINEFINTDCLIKMSSMLDHLGTVERMTGHDAKKAYNTLKYAFDIPMDRMQSNTLPRDLEKESNTENRTAGGFGQLLQFVAQKAL